jgi:hypothetical protein
MKVTPKTILVETDGIQYGVIIVGNYGNTKLRYYDQYGDEITDSDLFCYCLYFHLVKFCG